MPEAVKFPSARQDVFFLDPQTKSPVFTRPWFLFFQALWQRQGGAIAQDTNDLEGSLFEDAGTGETNAALYQLTQDLAQIPVMQQLVEQVSTLQAQLDEQRDLIAELTKAVQAVNQGPII